MRLTKANFILAAALLLMGAAAIPKAEYDCTLTVEVADMNDGTADHRYWCHTPTETLKIKTPANFKHGKFQTGQKIKAHGRKTIERGQAVLEIDGDSDLQPTSALTTGSQFTTIPNAILGMCVYYSTQPAPCTPQTLKDFFISQVVPFYTEQSSGRVTFVGLKDTTAPGDFINVSIPYTGGCDTGTIINQADQAAAALGYAGSLSYHRYLYVIPDSPCGWKGLATVGWYGRFAIANGDMALWIIAHELGHNMGFYHCGADGGGEYADMSCMMGNKAGVFAASQLRFAAWMDSTKVPSSQVVTTGTFTIDIFDGPGLGVKSLRVLNPATTDEYYYIDCRSGRWGFGASSGYYPGCYLHIATEQNPAYSRLANWVNAGPQLPASGGTINGLPYKFSIVSQTATQYTIKVEIPGTDPDPPTGTATLNVTFPKTMQLQLNDGSTISVPLEVQ